MKQQHVDVLIVGAGISGIGMACHLTRECPGKTYAVLERRNAIGGTWDLFRYPGIRSDSDMYTFGFNFKPWNEPRVLADGPSIRQYVNEAATEFGVDRHIQFGRKVTNANWSSADKVWTVQVLNESNNEVETYTANFLVGAAGYYNYDKGYRPEFTGESDFQGQIIHPQFWPEELDYTGKKVVIIGSGATAITLVPSMTDKAAHVTMLQRSPTYIMSIPSIDPVAKGMQRFLPEMLVYRINRVRNIGLQRMLFEAARRRPAAVRRLLLGLVRRQLAGSNVDMKHFTPSYAPWDQRLCVVPNGDLFKVLRSGKASVVTDHIDRFTSNGIRLKSGEEIEADIIITATGLDVQMMGGVSTKVDGQPIKVPDVLTYRGVLLEGIPNAAMIFGYTNASWTLKADIAAEYVCRLLNHMDKQGYSTVKPIDSEGCKVEDTVLGSLSSGYIQRAADSLPRQGSKAPWQVQQNYVHDVQRLRFAPMEDDTLSFDGKPPVKSNVGVMGKMPESLRSALRLG
jgi:cation diffusion facilitator CzcD-associated flavoprotein CzcO